MCLLYVKWCDVGGQMGTTIMMMVRVHDERRVPAEMLGCQRLASDKMWLCFPRLQTWEAAGRRHLDARPDGEMG